MKNAADAQSNYAASSGRAQGAWVKGIQSTTKDQAALAVAAIPRMVQGFNDAANSGRIARGLQRGGTGYWKSQSEQKAGAYGLGIQNGASNFATAITKILAAEQNIVNSLPARGDINANLQRANAFALGMHQLKGTLGARS